jgi:probable phosphoglycerate mutase
MQICFLRHGPTEWNAQGRIQGHTDIPLSDAGQAKMRGLTAPDPFGPPNRARVFASPSTRARQTAAALGWPNPTLDPRLMEQHWGNWEGLTRDEILARDGSDCFTRAGLAGDFTPAGGESTQALLARLAAFLKDTAKGEGDAVAVAHFGILRSAYVLATGWDMATPVPEGFDVNKALILNLIPDGTVSLAAMNVELKPRTA